MIVYGFFVSIVNIMDMLGTELNYYLNNFNILLFVITIIYIIFKPMINIFLYDSSKIYANTTYIWISVIYVIGCAMLFAKCKRENSPFCNNYGILIFTIMSILYLFIFMIFNLITTITKEGLDGSTVTTILPIPVAPQEFNYSLASYYVMTASDCCLDPSNTTVSIDALKNVISKGAR
jgi:hypothetical protein